MLRRVAGTFYWMARNIERAENNARIIAVRLGRIPGSWEEAAAATVYLRTTANPDHRPDEKEAAADLGTDSLGGEREWEDLLEICASLADYRDTGLPMELEAILRYLTVSAHNPNSVLNCVACARSNARSASDAIPRELWEALNDMYWNVKQAEDEPLATGDLHSFLQGVKQSSFTTQGVIESLMPRGAPYLFVQLGKWLERAEKTARILNVVCSNATKPGEWPHSRQYYHWLTALELVGGYDAFLRQYPPYMNTQDVLAFLVADPAFPRSIRYCVEHAIQGLERLGEEGVSFESVKIGEALRGLIEQSGEARIREWPLYDLEKFLDRVQNDCNAAGALLTEALHSGGVTVERDAMIYIQE
ncbi:alpha-E domain-containing protein [Paenibacillus hodogayensis]|uniref:Alpha-E domain-containing protein n=1 Tax=Paenibacillus hodogayensis TaxID=279208 RepID=A0ABV5W3Y0_9BACL